MARNNAFVAAGAGWLLIKAVTLASSCRTPGFAGLPAVLEKSGFFDRRLLPPATRLQARVVPAGQSCALPLSASCPVKKMSGVPAAHPAGYSVFFSVPTHRDVGSAEQRRERCEPRRPLRGLGSPFSAWPTYGLLAEMQKIKPGLKRRTVTPANAGGQRLCCWLLSESALVWHKRYQRQIPLSLTLPRGGG